MESAGGLSHGDHHDNKTPESAAPGDSSLTSVVMPTALTGGLYLLFWMWRRRDRFKTGDDVIYFPMVSFGAAAVAYVGIASILMGYGDADKLVPLLWLSGILYTMGMAVVWHYFRLPRLPTRRAS